MVVPVLWGRGPGLKLSPPQHGPPSRTLGPSPHARARKEQLASVSGRCGPCWLWTQVGWGLSLHFTHLLSPELKGHLPTRASPHQPCLSSGVTIQEGEARGVPTLGTLP